MHLPPNEQIIYQSKPHWIFLAKPAALTLVGFFCTACTALTALAEPPPGQAPPPEGMLYTMGTCSACIFVAAFLVVLVRFTHYESAEFTLTNRRVILEHLQSRQHSLEIFLRQIDSVAVETSALGDLLGYGDVVIMAGAARQPLRRFANPQQIRHLIQEQIAGTY